MAESPKRRKDRKSAKTQWPAKTSRGSKIRRNSTRKHVEELDAQWGHNELEDDGFHIQQLLINLSTFDVVPHHHVQQRTLRRTTMSPDSPRLTALQNTLSKPSLSGSYYHHLEDKIPREDLSRAEIQLMQCIRRVLDITHNRIVSNQLQDLLLQWMHPQRSEKAPKIVDQEVFVQNRKDFWNTFHADTRRWEGKGSIPITGIKPSLAKSPLLCASLAAARLFPEERAWKKTMRAVARSATRGAVELPGASQRENGDTRRPSTAPESGCLHSRKQEQVRREKALLADVVGESTSLPRQDSPAILSQLPGYFEMTGRRRIGHREKAGRLVDGRPSTSPASTPVDNNLASLPASRDILQKPMDVSCNLCTDRAFDHIFHDPPENARRIDIGKNRLCKPIPGGAIAEQARQRQNARLRLVKPSFKLSELDHASAFAERIHPYSRKNIEHLSAPLPKCQSMPLLTKAASECDYFTKDAPHGGHPANKPAKGVFQDVAPAKCVRSGRWRYMKECERLNVIPRMPQFLVDDSTNVGLPKEAGGPTADAPDDMLVVSINGQRMRDRDLIALREPLQTLDSPQIRLDISDNMFSDVAIAKLLEELPSRNVCSLDLSRSGAGSTSVEVLVEQVQMKWPQLHVLQLAGCTVAESAWESLCNAFTHFIAPTRLDFVDMSLGRTSQQVIQHVADVMTHAQRLEHLDLSGNFIFYEGFEALAEAVKKTTTLRVLDISHNAATQGVAPSRTRPWQASKAHGAHPPPNVSPGPGGGLIEELPTFHPAAALAEALGENISLRELRMQGSFLDFSVDCCLLHAVQAHPMLQSMDLSDNPHGVDGLRALLRLIVTPGLKLEYCNVKDLRPGCLGPGVAQIEFGAPGAGPYNLNLAHPQNRAVVRWLLKVSETVGGLKDPQSAFVHVHWSGVYGTPVQAGDPWCWRDGRGNWNLPTSGLLSFEFLLDVHLEKEQSAQSALKKWQRIRRVPITLNRFVFLLNMFQASDTADEKRLFVNAMSDTLSPKTCHIRRLVDACPTVIDDTVRTLFPHAIDPDPLMLFDLVTMHVDLGRDFFREARTCFFWNTRLPTNNYALDLHSPLDKAVAERLFVVNNFEAAIWRNLNGPDVSQHGNYEGVRNLQWEAVKQTSLTMFSIPNHGIMRLDYVSPPHYCPKRRDAVVHKDFVFDLIEALEISPCAVEDKINALRTMAHNLVLDEEQVHYICEVFPNPSVNKSPSAGISREMKLSQEGKDIKSRYDIEGYLGSAFQLRMPNPRAEAFVLCFTRCVEPPALCTYACLWDTNLFTREDSKAIGDRLGHARTMDPLHCCKPYGLSPAASKRRSFTSALAAVITTQLSSSGGVREAGRRYTLHLDTWEDWIVATYLLALDDLEEGLSLVKCEWSERAHLAERGIDFMIPTDWHTHGHIPHVGTLSATYISESEEQILMDDRRSLAEKFFAWEPL